MERESSGMRVLNLLNDDAMWERWFGDFLKICGDKSDEINRELLSGFFDQRIKELVGQWENDLCGMKDSDVQALIKRKKRLFNAALINGERRRREGDRSSRLILYVSALVLVAMGGATFKACEEARQEIVAAIDRMEE
ncbi:hypothetical protein KA119_00605 [Candidatus Gracilibacteria bacterium]|nr:hypothetical protein [Candidatus Gracilibacteria bacterium]